MVPVVRSCLPFEGKKACAAARRRLNCHGRSVAVQGWQAVAGLVDLKLRAFAVARAGGLVVLEEVSGATASA